MPCVYQSLLWGEIRPFRGECWACRQEDDVRTEVSCRPEVRPQGQCCTKHQDYEAFVPTNCTIAGVVVSV